MPTARYVVQTGTRRYEVRERTVPVPDHESAVLRVEA